MKTSTLVLGLQAGLTLSCASGPYTLWRGMTPDRRHSVEVLEASGAQRVRVDGHDAAAFDAVATQSVTFSDDGKHLAYAAQRGNRWFVVHDGRVGDAWDAIGEIVLATNGRVAYSAERRGGWSAVIDEKPGPTFESLLAHTLRFSADAQHLAYAASERGVVRVVVDDHVDPEFDGVGQLQLSDDGKHVAYEARRGSRAYVVLDGEFDGPWESVDHLLLGKNGRLAYLARDGGTWTVLWSKLDGPGLFSSGPLDRSGGLAMSSDGRHVAWVARTGVVDSIFMDGEPLEETVATVSTSTLAFRPASSEVAFLARGTDHRVHAVVGDHVGSPFDVVEGNEIVFSEDGSHFGYTARRGGEFVVVVDGSERASESWAGPPVFNVDGSRFGYLARRGTRTGVVVDGVSHEFDVALDDTLAFDRAGRHWACVAGSRKEKQLFFVVDGHRTRRLDLEEVISAATRLSVEELLAGRGNRTLRSWASAEAELASDGE
jgi:hypothetical protein